MATYGKHDRRTKRLATDFSLFIDDGQTELTAQPRSLTLRNYQRQLSSSLPAEGSDDELAGDGSIDTALTLPMPSFSTSVRYRSLSLPRRTAAAERKGGETIEKTPHALPSVPQVEGPSKSLSPALLPDKTKDGAMAPSNASLSRRLKISSPYNMVKGDLPSELTTALAAHKNLHPSRSQASPALRPITPSSGQRTSSDLDFLSTEYRHVEPRSSPAARRSSSKGRRVLAKRSEKKNDDTVNDTGFFSRVKDVISRSFGSTSSQSTSQVSLRPTPSYGNLPEELSVVKEGENSPTKLQRHYGYSDNDKQLHGSQPQRRARSVGPRGEARQKQLPSHDSGEASMNISKDVVRLRPQTIMGNGRGAYDGFAAWATESIRAIGTDGADATDVKDDGLNRSIYHNNTINTPRNGLNVHAASGYPGQEMRYKHNNAMKTLDIDHEAPLDQETVDAHLGSPFVFYTSGSGLDLHHTTTPGVDFAHYHYSKDDEEYSEEAKKGCLCQQRAAEYLGTEVSRLADFDFSLGPPSTFSCAKSPLEQHPNVLDFAELPAWYKMSMQTMTVLEISRSSTTVGQTGPSTQRERPEKDVPPASSISTAYEDHSGRRYTQFSTPTVPQIQLNRASDTSKRSSGDAEICGNSPRKSEWKKGKTFAHTGSPLPALQLPSPYCDEMDFYVPTGSTNSRGASLDTNSRDYFSRTSNDSFGALLLERPSRASDDSFQQYSSGRNRRPSRPYRKSMPMYLRPSTEMDMDDIDELSADQPYAIGLAR